MTALASLITSFAALLAPDPGNDAKLRKWMTDTRAADLPRGGSVVPPCPPGRWILLRDSACRCRRADAGLAHLQKSDIYLIYRWSQAGRRKS
jgi:hypothetical protein